MPGRFNPPNHHRRSIRLPGYDYSQPGEYFVTICAYERRNLFGQIENGEMQLTPVGKVLEREWLRLPDRFPFLQPGPYVVMPNHFHGILVIEDVTGGRGTARLITTVSPSRPRRAPTDSEFAEAFGKPVRGSIPTIVRSFKASVTLRINRMSNCPDHPVWQPNYYEHIIRDEADRLRIQTYIRENPRLWDEDQINPNRPGQNLQ